MSISQSSMDKLKTVAVLQVFTTESVEDAAFYEDTSTTGSYTEVSSLAYIVFYQRNLRQTLRIKL